MAIYGDLLAVAFGDIGQQDDFAVLIQTALLARVEVKRTRSCDGVTEYLASQLEYDRALIRLCLACGFETDPSRFERPAIERHRLEDALVAIGVDLESASKMVEGTA